LQKRIDQFHNLRAEVISINPDTGDQAQQVVQRIGATFPLLSDPDLSVTTQFDMQLRAGWPMGDMRGAFPAMGYVIVDGNGIIRAQRVETYFGDAGPQILNWLKELP
jgi:peroxiredoxin